MFRRLIAVTTIALMILAYIPCITFAEDEASDQGSESVKTEETKEPSKPEAKPDPAPQPEPEAQSEPAQQEEPQTEADKPEASQAEKDETISVSFKLSVEDSDWIKSKSIKAEKNITLKKFLKDYFKEQEFKWNDDDGKIVSITKPAKGSNETVRLANDKETGAEWVVYFNKKKYDTKPLERKLKNKDKIQIIYAKEAADVVEDTDTADEEDADADVEEATGDADEEAAADIDGTIDDEDAAEPAGGGTADPVIAEDAGTAAQEGSEAFAEGDVEGEALTEEELLLLLEESELLEAFASESTIKTRAEATAGTVAETGEKSKWAVGTEFMAIGLARAEGLKESYATQYCQNLVNKLDSNKSPVLNERQSSDNAKAIIALTSMGVDPTDVYGYDLLKPLSDMDFVSKQGINGIIWTMIAIDSHDYDIPDCGNEAKQTTREKLVDTLLSGRKDDGGWAFTGSKSDVDMTAMALQALAPYYGKPGNEEVTKAVDEAVEWLSNTQDANGNFSTVGLVTSESTSQVIVALCSLGINPNTDPRFIKNGKSAVDSLLSFYSNGGFKHIYAETTRNSLGTTQGNYALAAYGRLIGGSTALYDMSDILSLTRTTLKPGQNNEEEEEEDIRALGRTRSLGVTLLLKGVSGAAKDVIEQINAAVKSGDENAAMEAYKAYLELSKAEKLAVRKDDCWKPYKELTDSFGRANHIDEATGVDMRASKEKALPWYIKLVVKEDTLTQDQTDAIVSKIGEDGAIRSTFDLSFINTLTGEAWHPEKIISVSFRVPPNENPDQPVYPTTFVYHITKDGMIEFVQGTLHDDIIDIKAADFSVYGVASMNGTIADLLAGGITERATNASDENPISQLWILVAIAAAALIALLLMIMYRVNHRSEEHE